MRPQAVVLPILRSALPDVAVVSTLPDVDHRTLPMVVVRRSGGTRNPAQPQLHSLPQVDLEAVSADGLVEAEELYEDVLDALYAAVAAQTVVPNAGHLQSLAETQGPAQTRSEVPDSWAVAGSVRLAL